MAAGNVVKVIPLWSKPTATLTRSGGRAVMAYEVSFDKISEANAIAALTANDGTTRIPVIGEVLSGTNFVCENVGPTQPRSGNLHVVPVTFIGESTDTEGNVFLDRRWSGVRTVEPVDRDVNGNLIKDTAGQPLDPPMQFEFIDRVLTISRVESNWDDSRLDYIDTVCSHPFYSRAAGTPRMMDIVANEITSTVAEVTYKIQFRKGIPVQPDGSGGPAKAWYKRRLNAGFKAADGTVFEQITKLDINGNKLADGSDYSEVWLEVQQFDSLPWVSLGLE
ncbi:hypothetical protein HED60_15035 [Planctomycetales bacterium ZRK34]|nr:hypothetical protein HED60_15035 [Planctomycetales bacterium ZRK34]